MKKMTTRMITINGIIISIFLLFFLVPSLGYINVGVVKLTLMHILFIIGTYALYLTVNVNLIVAGVIYGLVFGLTSLVQELLYPGPTAFIFVNPLFSIIPRVLMGLCVGTIAYGFNKVSDCVEAKIYHNDYVHLTWFQKHYLKTFNLIIAISTSTFNTLFVLVFMYFIGPLVYPEPEHETFFKAFTWIILATNYLPETILVILIFPPIAYALRKLYS